MSTRATRPDAAAGTICLHCRARVTLAGMSVCARCLLPDEVADLIHRLTVERELAEKRAAVAEGQLAKLQQATGRR